MLAGRVARAPRPRKLSQSMRDLDSSLQIFRGLSHTFRRPQIAPVILVRAEAKNLLSLSRGAKVRSDDRKRPFLAEHGKKTRRNYMDSTKSQRLYIL